MLTLTAMFATERQGVPRVAYITYLDVWMVGKFHVSSSFYYYIYFISMCLHG